MRKKEVIDYILTKVNKRTNKQHDLNKEDIDAVIMAFKECILECICRCEEIVYFNFLEVESKVIKVIRRKNPRTQKPLEDIYRIRYSINLGYRPDRIIREHEVEEIAKENTLAKHGKIINKSNH